MKPTPMERDARVLSWSARIREGFLYARNDLRVRTLLTLLAIVIGFGWGYVAIMPALAEEVLGLGAAGYGTLMSVNGAGALLGALWIAGRAVPGSRRALRAEVFRSVTIAALGVLGLGLATTPAAAAVALVVSGFGAICFLSRGNTLVQTAVPDALRGRVMSLWVFVFIGSSGVGGLLHGLAAERWGVPVAVYGSGVVCLLLAIAVAWRLPPPTDEPRPGELPPGGRAGETLDPAADATSTARVAASPLESETSP
jgi:MFS family permease